MPLASSSYSYPLLGAFWTIFLIFLWVIWIWVLICGPAGQAGRPPRPGSHLRSGVREPEGQGPGRLTRLAPLRQLGRPQRRPPPPEEGDTMILLSPATAES